MRLSCHLKALAVLAVILLFYGCTGPVMNSRRSSKAESPAASIPGEHGPVPQTSAQTIELQELLKTFEARMEGHRDAEELSAGELIELTRLYFMLGERVGKDEKKALYEKGRQVAELLIQREPSRVEGHYWLSLNLGGVAQNSRAGQALGLVPLIVDALEIAVKLDETYNGGGPHRVIGRIYSQAPAWPISVGDLDKSLHHLRQAVQIAPENSTNRLYLAECLIQIGRTDEAVMELEKILTSVQPNPLTDDFERERRQAIRLIASLRGNQ